MLFELWTPLMSSHVEYFTENPRLCSEQQGENAHEDVKVVEKRYQGFWNENKSILLDKSCKRNWIRPSEDARINHFRSYYKVEHWYLLMLPWIPQNLVDYYYRGWSGIWHRYKRRATKRCNPIHNDDSD